MLMSLAADRSTTTEAPLSGLFARSRTVTVNVPAGSAVPASEPTRWKHGGTEEFPALGTPASAAEASMRPPAVSSTALRIKPVIVAPPLKGEILLRCFRQGSVA